MSAIFSRFDKTKISQLFFSANENPDINSCSAFYQYTDMDLLKHLVGKDKDTYLVDQNHHKNGVVKLESNSSRIFRWLKYTFSSSTLFREFFWLRANQNKKILDEISIAKFDAIFLYAGNLTNVYDFAIYYSQKMAIPIFPYFTDDYAFYPHKSIFTWIQKKWIQKKCHSVIKHAPFCFGIGEKMCDFYSLKFNRLFYPIMNSIVVPQEKKYKDAKGCKDLLNIVYIGGLTIGREYSILELSKLFAISETNRNVEFHVYTPTQLSKNLLLKLHRNKVYVHEAVYENKLRNVIQNADVLLHIESSKRKFHSFAMLSISTKIPEYLVSGKLILAYGPSFIASFSLLIKERLGIIIPSEIPRKEQLLKIEEFLLVIKNSSQIRTRAFLYAKNNFNIDSTSNNFYNQINNYITNGRQ